MHLISGDFFVDFEPGSNEGILEVRNSTMYAAEPKDNYLDVNGLRLHYLEWGSRCNRPMLLLHGFMGHAHVWDSFSLEFRDHYHVIALDQRGHGDSQWSEEAAYSMDAYARDIAGFVELLDLHDLVLIGHSMGGRNGLLYTVCVPEKVRCLVIVDARPGDNPESKKSLKQLLVQFPLETDSLDRVAESIQKLYHYVPEETACHIANYGYKRSIHGKYVPKFDTRINLQCRKANYCAEDLWSLLQFAVRPTLIVRGEDSLFLSREEANKMLNSFPNAILREIPLSTHMPVQENSEVFKRVVSDFLNIY
jgi:pimeloyl-ACP methyl ester carboxylesterase